MNLTYEVTTIWDLNRAGDFCVEITKGWKLEDKSHFIVSLYERYIDECIIMSNDPDISFIVKITEVFTKGWNERCKLKMLSIVFPHWTQKEIQDFLRKFTLDKTPQVYAFIRNQIVGWTNQQVANFVLKMTGGIKINLFIHFFQEITQGLNTPNKKDVVRRIVTSLKQRYLTFHCGCGECRNKYLDRISVLAMLGLEKFVL